MIDHPSERDFKSVVRNNMNQNYPITASDITNAHTMFGTNLAGTRGKTMQQNTDRPIMDCVVVTKDFMKLQKFVTLV